MKKIGCVICFCLLACFLFAQDTAPVVEPGYETSFNNTELWLVVVLGFLLLVGVYFLFRKRKRNG